MFLCICSYDASHPLLVLGIHVTAAGIDVPALLQRLGLKPSDTSEKVGTFAIAYAAHKALSPVRFPPTVALTPVVAKLIGKKPTDADEPQDL